MNKPYEILTGNNTLLDTVLDEIRIFSDKSDHINIELSISNFRKESKFSKIKLLFENVIEYSFYHNMDYDFYNVEDYKFMKTKEGTYISLDPDNDSNEKSENDKDFIFSKDVKIIEV